MADTAAVAILPNSPDAQVAQQKRKKHVQLIPAMVQPQHKAGLRYQPHRQQPQRVTGRTVCIARAHHHAPQIQWKGDASDQAPLGGIVQQAHARMVDNHAHKGDDLEQPGVQVSANFILIHRIFLHGVSIAHRAAFAQPQNCLSRPRAAPVSAASGRDSVSCWICKEVRATDRAAASLRQLYDIKRL